METSSATRIFSALAQESRLTALRILLAHGPTGLSAGELADRLSAPPSTASFHLAALERAGLITSTRQGRQLIYAVHIATLRELLVYLTESCCGGRPELCGDIAEMLPVPAASATLTAAFNVLFVCARNSARSIMAEAILSRLGGDRFRAYSAGSDPGATLMPEVMEMLQALGHDVSRLQSKTWDAFIGPAAPRVDFLITLCDMDESPGLRDFGDKVIASAWPLPDPAMFTGSTVERWSLLHELYGSLYRRILAFIGLPFDTLERPELKVRLDEIGLGPIAAMVRDGDLRLNGRLLTRGDPIRAEI